MTRSSYRLLKPESRRAKPPVDDYGKAYVAGNIVEGNSRVTADNWDGGVQVESIADPETILPKVKSDKPYPSAYLDLQPAAEAYEIVLANSGATRPKRDAVDERVVEMVRTGNDHRKADQRLCGRAGQGSFRTADDSGNLRRR